MKSLLDDAKDIWLAGVAAVKPERLFATKVSLQGTSLVIDDCELDLSYVRRLVVVGAGKASAAMAIALHHQVLSQLPSRVSKLQVVGWINCPEGTVTEQIPNITLCEARPAGSNSPTPAAFRGTLRMLELVASTDRRDAVLCLLSGGGSALMVAPLEGLDVDDKQQVAGVVAAAGGNIEQLNLVRRAASQIKGGGLARACRAGRLITLIISDVPGDPLETIASGPTLLTASPSPEAALQVLKDLRVFDDPRLARVVRALQQPRPSANNRDPLAVADIDHIVLGNNADAVDAAGVRAVELGYRYVMQSAIRPEGDVMAVAMAAKAAVQQLMSQHEIDCWISGGEPTVALPPNHGRGGRNQQLSLAVLAELMREGWPQRSPAELAFMSGGTDGEDGPTDVAGAGFDIEIARRAQELGLDAQRFLRHADAYHFFQACGGLIFTGPTGTNVCDVRVALTRSEAGSQR